MAIAPWLTLVFMTICDCAIQFRTDEGVWLNSPVTVGNGSDVLIQVTCSDSDIGGNWSFSNGTTVPDPLTAFGISQDPVGGVLRIYPAPLIEGEGLETYMCNVNETLETLTFLLQESLFFIEPLPSFLRPSDTPTLNCTLPEIPRSNVTFTANPGNVLCSVGSDRGSFSRLVPILPNDTVITPQFIVQPVNITVGDEAAFACVIAPDQLPPNGPSLLNITWLFLTDLNMTDMITEDVVERVTEGVLDSFPYPGASILRIKMVDPVDIGLYYCLAYFLDGSSLTSEMASLEINDTIATDPFLLTPPTSLTVTEGDTFTLPCIAADNQAVNWTYEGQGMFNSTDFGTVIVDNVSISIISVGRSANGMLVCTTVAGETTVTNIAVSAGLLFDSAPYNETLVTRGNDITISCDVSGNPAPYPIQWLRNDTLITPTNENIVINNGSITLFNAQPNDTAIYQCVAMTTTERISAYTYLIVEFIEEIIESPETILVDPVEKVDFNISCTVGSHPLVEIEWEGDVGVARQVPVGFRGPSVSELTLNSGELSGRSQFNCSAQLNEEQRRGSVIVNAFSMVTITVQPMDTPLVVVGYTVTFLCEASSVPAPFINWFRRLDNSEVGVVSPDDVNVFISSSVVDNTTAGNLTITVSNLGDFGDYFCVADNGFFNATSEDATLMRGEEASILTDPSSVIMVTGDEVSFTCVARGVPPPSITWLSPDGFEATSTPLNSTTVRSTLVGVASVNESTIQCQAVNMFRQVSSVTVLIIIAGPPGAPLITQDVTGPRSSTIQWDSPFSLLPITEYTVTVLDREGVTSIPTIGGINVTMATIENLIPFTAYTVQVIAINRAGPGPLGEYMIETEQAAPTAPPTNLSSSAVLLGEIIVTWAPPPLNQQNGIIKDYVVFYREIGQDIIASTTVTGSQLNVTLGSLNDGALYRITVFARTVAAPGPNVTITQATINTPPAIANNTPSTSISPGSTSSFPIVVPSFAIEDVAVIWIVVIKVSQSFDTSQSPDILYPNNNSFIFASEFTTIPLNSPYITAELSTSNDAINFPYSFLIGDQAVTQPINDYPAYTNPPLDSATSYTAFIRVFPPAAGQDSVTKRQAQPIRRQYSVFTSTRFVPVVMTASPSTGGLSGGEAAGIAISLVLLITVVVIVAVVLFMFWRSSRYYSRTLPPPSRKGSMRLTESQKLLDSPFPNVRHKKGTEIVTVVQNLQTGGAGPLSPLTPSDQRVPILGPNFPDYVRTLHCNSDHLFAEEYELIGIKSPSLSHQHSQLPWNTGKNRYANINSYDSSRVLLKEIQGVQGSDYINANYISGYKDVMYVAAQGPLPETTYDFWRMVWEQNSSCVIMLTNTIEKGRPKCHQYWPSSGSISFSDLTITMVDQQTLAYYTIRTFILTVGDDRREVKQFHYTSWPDFGVPDHPNPIISFMRRVNNSSRKSDGPAIIHCSAGVGRTGTYITIQSMMQMIEEEERLDIFNFVLGMRHERNIMVQTEAQYIFIHDTLLELIKVGETELSIQKLPKELKVLTETTEEDDVCLLERQFDDLNSLDMPNTSHYVSSMLPINREKNRYPDILPYEPYRVRLLMLPGMLGSDYINASYIDGYLRKNQFILTQGPLQNTVSDFWRMIWEHRVSAIVMLCPLEERGKEQSAQYWPSDKITQYGDMFVETVKEKNDGVYTTREFQITHTKQNNDVRNLKQFHYTGWSEEACPESGSSLLDMISLVQKAHHLYGGGPVVVHDSSSIGRAGTFCIMNIVIERLKVEGMVDIFFTIHSLRRKHPGIVTTYDQYLFCFKTMQEYLNSFDKYSNFD